MNHSQKKVILGFSGGVDSAVTGYLLKKQGYEVKAVFLKLWKNSLEGEQEQKRQIKKAQKIAQQLSINLEVVDVVSEFYKIVVQYYLQKLQEGKTPNPCFICNPQLKIKGLIDWLEKEKADYVATGHYARLSKDKKDKKHLWKAKDLNKDQSYFLAGLSQKQLSKIIFPLGNLTKLEVKKIAQKLNLTKIIEQKESQELCFLYSGTEKLFLKQKLKPTSGEIVDIRGKKTGKHQGLVFYTIGQRKGIGLGGDGPYYVIQKNKKNNQLIVSNNLKQKDIGTKEMKIKKVNWLNKEFDFKSEILVKTRYQQKAKLAHLKKINNTTWKVIFKTKQLFVTPGQAAVFYSQAGEVLGGGEIE